MNAARKEARVEADKTKKAVKTLQSKVEKPTLGDLGALAQIKERLQQEEKGGGASASPETPAAE
jgi:small subunit ribosomal protein S1